MFIVRDTPPVFEDVAEYVSRSVIAIAIGTRDDGSPNIVGTGFALRRAEFFATSWHVSEIGEGISALSKAEMEEKGLIDDVFRIALPDGDGYEWHEIESDSLMCSHNKDHDVCVYRIIGAEVPPLQLLAGDQWSWGSEVGIIGFPMGSLLQGVVLRPYVLKTVISGGLELPLPGGHKHTPRLALGISVAGGFSGGPVFSARDGQVVGMISSQTIEKDELGSWPAGISLAVTPYLIRRELKRHTKKTDELIKRCLWPEFSGEEDEDEAKEIEPSEDMSEDGGLEDDE